MENEIFLALDQAISRNIEQVTLLQNLKQDFMRVTGFNGIQPLMGKVLHVGKRGGIYYLKEDGSKQFLAPGAAKTCVQTGTLYGQEIACAEIRAEHF